jgi:S1-C subfamily serine protease
MRDLFPSPGPRSGIDAGPGGLPVHSVAPAPQRARHGAMRLSFLLLLLLLAPLPVPQAADGPGLEESVLRIVNFSQRGDWYTPWNLSPVREASGTGFVIEGGLVMTNAHVVSDTRHLLMFLPNDPEPHEAEVHLIGHDCDLALLKPKEPGLLEDVPSLRFGGQPRLGSSVVTLGYPVGGTRVSSTQGVVSRIDSQLYLHSGVDVHFTVQTDAAINPGNSGGPVLQDGRVVGVAFQAAQDLQSVGYFIPMEVIDRFQRDVEDGHYDGYPELGVRTTGMENGAARRQAGMRDDESGTRVDMVYPASSADGWLRPGDVLLQVDGFPVANDGTVADGEERFDFGMLVDRHQKGESVSLRVLRDGERLDLTVPLAGSPWGRRNANMYDVLPRYYVHGGLVFVPFDMEMLKNFGDDWISTADKDLLYEFMVRPYEEPDLTIHERVVLLRRLKHPVNADMAWFRNQVVVRVNGRDIRSLDDLIEAIETHDGDFHFFEFASHRRFGVLSRQEAKRSNAEILERYGVFQDRRP